MAIITELNINDLNGVKNMLTRIRGMGGKDRSELHMRYGIKTMQWIDRNFRTEGGEVGGWKTLSPNTLAARRGESGRILQDRGAGGLHGSFHMLWDETSVRVGSPLKIAEYHEKGTGLYGPKGAKYPIEPKTKKFLAFKVAAFFGVRTKTLITGRRISIPFAKASKNMIFLKKVMHPGVAIRRMLPKQTDDSLMTELLRVTLNYAKELERGGTAQ